MIQELDLQELVTWNQEQQFTINLSNEKLGFLLAIALMQQHSDQELNESIMLDSYLSYLNFTNQSQDQAQHRLNSLITELLKQNILSLFRSNDPEQDSIYRLSPLALGITNHFLRQKEFSQLGLSMQLMVIANEMSKVSNNCSNHEMLLNKDYWRNNIYAPLRYGVIEIFDLIDYSQRKLDEQQTLIKQKIADLISEKWQDAIIASQELLQETSQNLKELQHTLAAAGDSLQSQLLIINRTIIETQNKINKVKQPLGLINILFANEEEIAKENLEITQNKDKLLEVEPIVTLSSNLIYRLQARIDRIVGWSQKTIDLWIGYDKYVHKFIRSAIDLDKNRIFAQRLSKSIGDYFENPWYLKVLRAENLISLRDNIADSELADQLGEIPPEIEFEDFQEVDDQLKQTIAQDLQEYYNSSNSLDLANYIASQLEKFNPAMHYHVTATIIGQAMLIGIAVEDLQGIVPDWQQINDYGSEIQANKINKFNK